MRNLRLLILILDDLLLGQAEQDWVYLKDPAGKGISATGQDLHRGAQSIKRQRFFSPDMLKIDRNLLEHIHRRQTRMLAEHQPVAHNRLCKAWLNAG